MIGGYGRNWRSRRSLVTEEEVIDILKQAFCDTIPPASIVQGSCVITLLSYDAQTGAADYIMTFDIIDEDMLETALDNTNSQITDIIAALPDVSDAVKNSIGPGIISKCI